MKIHIDGQRVSLANLRAAWQLATTVSIGETAAKRIAESNAHIAAVLAGGDQVYGVNTGLGSWRRFVSAITSWCIFRKISSDHTRSALAKICRMTASG